MLLAGTADCTLPGTVRSTCYFGTMSRTYKSSEFHDRSTVATGSVRSFKLLSKPTYYTDDSHAIHHRSTTGSRYGRRGHRVILRAVPVQSVRGSRCQYPCFLEARTQRSREATDVEHGEGSVARSQSHFEPTQTQYTVRSASDLSNAE